MAKTRDQMLAVLMLEKADIQLANWVRRFDKGFAGAMTKDDVAELAEFIDLRDQLRSECAGLHTEAPALPATGEVAEEPEPAPTPPISALGRPAGAY
jgi:hypothetical protein